MKAMCLCQSILTLLAEHNNLGGREDNGLHADNLEVHWLPLAHVNLQGIDVEDGFLVGHGSQDTQEPVADRGAADVDGAVGIGADWVHESPYQCFTSQVMSRATLPVGATGVISTGRRSMSCCPLGGTGG